MRILGIVASPRRLGNSEILVREMLGSLPADAEKEMLRLPELDIKPCQACYACLAKDNACVIKDDLAFLLERVKAADAVIIASPCYFLGPHVSIKTAGDRLMSVLANGETFGAKRCVTVLTYGIPGLEGYGREALNNFARFLHLEVVGSMLAQSANPGEAARADLIEAARALAVRLLEPETAGASVPGGPICCDDCGSSLLQIGADGGLRCVMCGARGELRFAGTETTATFIRRGEGFFGPEGAARHAQRLEKIKDNYIKNRGELFKIRKSYDRDGYWVEPNGANREVKS